MTPNKPERSDGMPKWMEEIRAKTYEHSNGYAIYEDLDTTFRALYIAIEALEDVSGYDCHNYYKYLSAKPCGKCSSCVPREALKRIAELGGDGE